MENESQVPAPEGQPAAPEQKPEPAAPERKPEPAAPERRAPHEWGIDPAHVAGAVAHRRWRDDRPVTRAQIRKAVAEWLAAPMSGVRRG